jgi:hypothetical protein
MSPGLIKHHAMKTYEGAEVKRHTLLTLAIDGSEWSVSHPAALSPAKGPRCPLNRRLSGTHSRSAHSEKRNLGLCKKHTNYYEVTHYAIYSDLPLFHLLEPNILPSTLSQNILNDKVSQPYKTN